MASRMRTTGRDIVSADPSLDWLDGVLDIWISAPAESRIVLEEPDAAAIDWLMEQMGRLDLELDPALEFDPAAAAASIHELMNRAVWSAIAAAGDSGGGVAASDGTTDTGGIAPAETTTSDTTTDISSEELLGPMPGPNQPPVANDDTYGVIHGATLIVDNFTIPGVKRNDTDPNMDPLTASLVTGPSHEDYFAFNDNGNGTFTYRSLRTFVGADTITYKVNDGSLDSNIATVTINVGNTPPVGNADAYTVVFCATLSVPAPGVLGNDSDSEEYDPLTAHLVTTTSNGTLSLSSDGSFTYTPAAGFSGADSFKYKVSDSFTYSAEVTVSIAVVRPLVDIDTDSNNNGVIDGTPEEDAIEMDSPGNILAYNADDDNASNSQDRTDPAPFRQGNDPNGALHGASTTVGGTADYEVDVSQTTWGAGLDHYSIDDDNNVKIGVKSRLVNRVNP